MRRPLLRWMLLLIASACATRAAAETGTNVRWDRCFGDGGVQFRDFACDTNAGAEVLVGTFELPADIPAVNGMECYLSIGSASATLPEWWKYQSLGSCRQNALSFIPALPAGSAACEAWVDPGLVSYNVAYYEAVGLGAHLARLAMFHATASQNVRDLVAGQEYHAFSLRISHSKTVGAGACGGCAEPVVIYLAAVVVTSDGAGSTQVWLGPDDTGNQWASWQQGYPINQFRYCAMTGGGHFCSKPSVYFDVVPNPPTSARGTSWGQLKSLYR